MKCQSKLKNVLSVINQCMITSGIVITSLFVMNAIQKKNQEKKNPPKDEKEKLTWKSLLQENQLSEALQDTVNNTLDDILEKADQINMNRRDFLGYFLTILNEVYSQTTTDDFDSWEIYDDYESLN